MLLAFVTRVNVTSQERKNEWTLDWALQVSAMVGLTAPQVYHMTIEELNIYLAYKNIRESEQVIETAWRTINFLGGFFSGKLGPLERYLPKTPQRLEEEEARDAAMVDGLKKLGFKR